MIFTRSFFLALLINISPAYAMNQPSSSSSSANVSSAPEEKKLLDDQTLLAHLLGKKARFFTDFPEVANALYPELKTKIAKLITRIMHRCIQFKQQIEALELSPDGTRIAIASYKSATVFDTFTSKYICESPQSGAILDFLCWKPDGTLIATDKQIFDSRTGKRVHYFLGRFHFQALSWSPGGTKLATVDCYNTVYIFDAHTYTELQEYPNVFESTSFDNRSLIWSLDGQCLALSGSNNLRRWRLQSVTQCPNGRLFVTTRDNTAHIADNEEGKDTVGEYSLACCELLHAFEIAYNDTEKLEKERLAREVSLSDRKHQVARIHADDAQWKTWKKLEALLPERAVKRLERYIVKAVEEDANLDGYETAME